LPSNLAQFTNVSQPVTLTITNGVATGSSTVTYTFEVATDAAFTNKVYTKSGVPAGANGQTSLTIDKIGAGQSYFWRARIDTGGAAGPYSTARGFTIGPAVVLQAPVLSDPANGSSVPPTPTLNVNNSQRTGPAGKVVYLLQVSDSPNFTSIVFSGNANERTDISVTSLNVTASLTVGKTYYWRAQANDTTNSVTSGFSSVSSFTVTPPFDMHQATIYNSPYNLADWAQTAHITSVIFDQDSMLVDFDLRDGPNRWPDTPFGDGSLEYTLGMCLNINNHWDCSAVVQFWFGRELTASGRPQDVGDLWFYDPARWGEMTGHQPAQGEIVGFFVMAGNGRNKPLGDGSYAIERSNVVFVPFTTNNDEAFAFNNAGVATPLNAGAARAMASKNAITIKRR
jgi:hypothetical protein